MAEASGWWTSERRESYEQNVGYGRGRFDRYQHQQQTTTNFQQQRGFIYKRKFFNNNNYYGGGGGRGNGGGRYFDNNNDSSWRAPPPQPFESSFHQQYRRFENQEVTTTTAAATTSQPFRPYQPYQPRRLVHHHNTSTVNHQVASASEVVTDRQDDVRATPPYRKPGESTNVRVIENESTVEHEVENIREWMGAYTILGFDVECFNANNENQAKNHPYHFHRNINVGGGRSKRQQQQRRRLQRQVSNNNDADEDESGDDNSSDEESDDSALSGMGVLPQTPCHHKRHEEVSVMIQLATWDGHVRLFRMPFWFRSEADARRRIPGGLRKLLADPAVIKVGVSVDDDARRLLEDWNIDVRGWLDLRNMCAEYSMYGHSKVQITKMGLKFMADSIFHNQNTHPLPPNIMKVMAWSNWNADRLSNAQIIYAAWDAQIAVDLFALMTQRLYKFELPRLDDKTYFQKLRARMGGLVERPGSSDSRLLNSDDDEDYESTEIDHISAEDWYNDYLRREKEKEEEESNEQARKKEEEEQRERVVVVKPPRQHRRYEIALDSLRPLLPLDIDPAIVCAGPTIPDLNGSEDGHAPLITVSSLSPEGFCVLAMHNGDWNQLDFPTLLSLKEEFQKLEMDQECVGVIFTADRSKKPKAFSIGLDVNELLKAETTSSRAFMSSLRAYLAAFFDLLYQIYQSNMITLALMNGITVGGAGLLALCCDRRVLLHEDYMCFNETEMGMPLPKWIMDRLVDVVGFNRAEYFFMSSTVINSVDALSCGLIDQIIPSKDKALDVALTVMRAMLVHSSLINPSIKLIQRDDAIKEYERERDLMLEQVARKLSSPVCQSIILRFVSRIRNQRR